MQNFYILYLIISGSSFTAVELCNSGLFSIRLFSMGLNKRQLALFRNKRVFTVVLLEVCTLIYFTDYITRFISTTHCKLYRMYHN